VRNVTRILVSQAMGSSCSGLVIRIRGDPSASHSLAANPVVLRGKGGQGRQGCRTGGSGPHILRRGILMLLGVDRTQTNAKILSSQAIRWDLACRLQPVFLIAELVMRFEYI